MKEFIAAMVIAFVIAVIVFYPIGVILSLNILFGLTIPVTAKTWCAVFVLVTIFATRIAYNKK